MSSGNGAPRVAFVDDHQVLVEGLVSLYGAMDDLEVVGQGYSAADALRIAEELQPDVLVMDLSMPGDTFATVEDITTRFPQTRIVIFTASAAIQPAIDLMEVGVAGYVLKGSSSSELHEAIRMACRGETFVTPGFATKIIVSMKTAEIRRRNQPTATRLHLREEQIVNCLLKGLTNREIGETLNISEKTVKHYMTSLLHKLNVRNRVQLVIAVKNRVGPKGTYSDLTIN